MKLVIAIIQDKDSGRLLNELTKVGIQATKLASTGGFLKEGNTTLLVGVEDHKVEQVTRIISRTCQAREQLITPVSPMGGAAESFVPYPIEVMVGGATILVLDVERFEKF